MWSAGPDYCGDAPDCLQALPLLAAFSQEMLSDDDNMKSAVASLIALYDVVLCLRLTHKMNWMEASKLSNLQTKHKPYGIWLIHKHPRDPSFIFLCVWPNKSNLCEDILTLQLVNESTASSKLLLRLRKKLLTALHEKYPVTAYPSGIGYVPGQWQIRWTPIPGVPQIQLEMNTQLALPYDARLGTDIEHRCVEYSRGIMFLQVSATCCIEIHGGVSAHVNICLCLQLLASPLKPRVSNGCTLWERTVAERAFVPAQKLKSSEPMRLIRAIDGLVWLLR